MSKVLEYLGLQRPAEPVQVSRTRMVVGLAIALVVVIVVSILLNR